jgi:hypothetical protein
VGSGQGKRAIVVDGVRYAWRGSWSHDLDGERLIRLAVWRDEDRGGALEGWFVGGWFITPGEVAAVIAFSRAHGWVPGKGRSPYRLHPGGGLTLPGWSVSRPAPIKCWAPEGPVFVVTLGTEAGEALAAELQIERVVDSRGEWQNRTFLVRDQGPWSSAYARSFADLLTLLGAAAGRVRHVDGASRRVPRQHVAFTPEEARQVAGPAPFDGARSLGDRVWLHGDGEASSIECITLQTNPPFVGSVWRWLTITRTGVVDRRAR